MYAFVEKSETYQYVLVEKVTLSVGMPKCSDTFFLIIFSLNFEDIT